MHLFIMYHKYVCIICKEIIAHEAYNDIYYDNDIALLRIEPISEFTTSVAPVCLPTKSFNSYVGDDLLVSGWGYLWEGENTNTICFINLIQYNLHLS